jgi:hypothetical protein
MLAMVLSLVDVWYSAKRKMRNNLEIRKAITTGCKSVTQQIENKSTQTYSLS